MAGIVVRFGSSGCREFKECQDRIMMNINLLEYIVQVEHDGFTISLNLSDWSSLTSKTTITTTTTTVAPTIDGLLQSSISWPDSDFRIIFRWTRKFTKQPPIRPWFFFRMLHTLEIENVCNPFDRIGSSIRMKRAQRVAPLIDYVRNCE